MLNYKKIDGIDDKYDIEDIILFDYYRVIKGTNDTNISYLINLDNHCELIKNGVFNSFDVYKLIKDTGKEFMNFCHDRLNLIYSRNNNISITELIDTLFMDKETRDNIISTYDRWIIDNGYPYLKEFEKNEGPSIPHFIKDCIMLFIISEIHIWMFKINKQLNKGYSSKQFSDTNPTYMFEFLVSLIKLELINSLERTDVENPIKDDVSDFEISNFLKYNEFDYKINCEKYFNALQRSLIVYIVGKFNNKRLKDNFLLTKQIPVYNKHSNQYRIYYCANSLMGIAYNKLLLDLTATKENYRRRICSNPECTNEFEKIGKIAYCEICVEKHIPSKLKNRKYNKYKRKKLINND